MLFIFSTPELIRNLWQLKTAVFLHWCLIRVVPLSGIWFTSELSMHKVNLKLTKLSFTRHFKQHTLFNSMCMAKQMAHRQMLFYNFLQLTFFLMTFSFKNITAKTSPFIDDGLLVQNKLGCLSEANFSG